MDPVTIAEAKEHLEELIERAARGEEVCVTDPSLGTVKLVHVTPASQAKPKRVAGQWKDGFEVPARLFEPLSEDELRWLSGEASPWGRSSTPIFSSGG
jgi:prevent-host-death family protein